MNIKHIFYFIQQINITFGCITFCCLFYSEAKSNVLNKPKYLNNVKVYLN